MSEAKAQKAEKAEKSDRNFVVTMGPPENQPQTFTDTRIVTDPETGEDSEEEFERPCIRVVGVSAKSEDAARLVAERQAFDIATQELGENADPDAILEIQYVVKDIEER